MTAVAASRGVVRTKKSANLSAWFLSYSRYSVIIIVIVILFFVPFFLYYKRIGSVFGVYTAFPEDLRLVPSTNIRQLSMPVTLAPRGSDVSDLLRHLHSLVYTHRDIHTYA